jgi:ABC-type sugar transport system permease subunit
VPATAELATPRRATPKPAERGENRAAVLFLAPWFAGLALITAGPMIASLYLSFTDYSLLDSPKWIGLGNYVRMLGDEQLHAALRVTFGYVFMTAGSSWGSLFADSVVSLVPIFVIFLFGQKYLVKGIATTGLK